MSKKPLDTRGRIAALNRRVTYLENLLIERGIVTEFEIRLKHPKTEAEWDAWVRAQTK
jgi:hypothetical protein